MKKNRNNGITLIVLVITIILLLILSGITIIQLTNSGLFEKGQLAKEKYGNAQAKENTILEDYEDTVDGYVEGSREQVRVDKEEYEQLKAKVEELSKKDEAVQSGENYIIFPNGLKMCWGKVSINTKSNVTVTLPIKFTNTNYNVSLSNTGGSTNSHFLEPISYGKTVSSMNILLYETCTSMNIGNRSHVIDYFCIGY